MTCVCKAVPHVRIHALEHTHTYTHTNTHTHTHTHTHCAPSHAWRRFETKPRFGVRYALDRDELNSSIHVIDGYKFSGGP